MNYQADNHGDRGRTRRFYRRLLLLVICLTMTGVVKAAGIQINEVRTHLQNDVYYLDARLGYVLTEKMLEALHKSVPLTFVLNIEVLRKRSYLWDVNVAELEQRYQLEYLPLTQQYQVRNLNSGALHNLPSLEVALSVLGTIVDLPLLDRELLADDDSYQARMRVELDIEELPLPLRLLSYFTDEWRLRSEWYTWPLQR